MSRRILVTGSGGQLGRTLIEHLGPRWEVRGLSRDELDLTDPDSVLERVREFRPHWILNCAAYTAVDLAEEHPGDAFAINDQALGHLADAALAVGSQIVHYSTDYVFDGEGREPYLESDPTSPLNVYGRSKLAGEDRLLRHEVPAAILRTSWLYSEREGNFFTTMVRLGQERAASGEPLGIVHDQVGTPTDTWSLARQTEKVLLGDHGGLFHASSTGQASWFEFARAIFDSMKIPVELRPITTEEFPRPAPRPRYSVLENHELERHGIQVLPPWEEGLEDVIIRFRHPGV